MKKLSLVLVVICAVALFASSAFAIDTSAGKFRVGGIANGTYTSVKPDSGSSTSEWMISGEAGYFVIPRLEVGAGLSFTGGDAPSSTTIRPYGRYYFPMGDNAWFAGLGFDSQSGDVGDASGFFVNGGYCIKLASNISADLRLDYDMISADGGGDGTMMTFGAGLSLWF
jgi:hypothetical protein